MTSRRWVTPVPSIIPSRGSSCSSSSCGTSQSHSPRRPTATTTAAVTTRSRCGPCSSRCAAEGRRAPLLLMRPFSGSLPPRSQWPAVVNAYLCVPRSQGLHALGYRDLVAARLAARVRLVPWLAGPRLQPCEARGVARRRCSCLEARWRRAPRAGTGLCCRRRRIVGLVGVPRLVGGSPLDGLAFTDRSLGWVRRSPHHDRPTARSLAPSP